MHCGVASVLIFDVRIHASRKLAHNLVVVTSVGRVVELGHTSAADRGAKELWLAVVGHVEKDIAARVQSLATARFWP